MAEVHIIDINGEQWDIKDLPLTDRVVILETKTTITTERLWASGSNFIDKVKINDEYFLQLHFMSFPYEGEAVQTIIQLSELIGNTETLRCHLMGDLSPQVDRISVDLDIQSNGEIVAVVLNQNTYSGGNFRIDLFGDAFIKIF